MARNPIDIIIPIYNAYDDLKKCIASVKKYTDLSYDRLILINDCSTDERMIPYLTTLQSDNILFINNEKNAGFSNNVNKGMGCSEDRDVILLNSDTIVTNNWVNKIYNCAYSKDEIGTVTPMSNSATLCSYPVMCQDNNIPESLSLDELADIVERCSLRRYPRITVAVGFCMFIKRRVINEVGLFDAETFERGYGEENDFCNRAEQFGYIHVMCDDTLIYHKGTVSFVSEEKQKLIDSHDKILVERYPAQMRKNHLYCMANPDKYIRDNIDIYAKIDPKRKNIMYVIQSDFRSDASDNMGGTQFHVRDLVMSLKDEYNVYVAARDGEYLRVTMYRDNEIVSLKYHIGAKDLFPRVKDSNLFKLFENLLKAFKIDLLHVHHMYGLSFDVVDAAEMLGVPVVLTMHDYYYICPNVKLFDCNSEYCAGNIDRGNCNQCLKKSLGVHIGKDFLVMWRNACDNMLKKCSSIIVPSEAARSIVLGVYSSLEEKIQVIEHGLELIDDAVEIEEEQIQISEEMRIVVDNALDIPGEPYKIAGWAYIDNVDASDVYPYVQVSCGDNEKVFKCAKLLRPDVSDAAGDERYINCGYSANIYDKQLLDKDIKFRVLLKYNGIFYSNGEWIDATVPTKSIREGYNVAFIGGMVKEKGSAFAKQMIQAKKKGINWHIFGTVGDRDLIELNQENLIKHGTYLQQELPRLLEQNNIDVVCILPTWPETFCYTLSEAITCNVPVFATDIGAVGERIKRHGYGWTVPTTMDGADMAKELLRILKDKEEYMVKKKTAVAFGEITIHNMSKEYITLYDRTFTEVKRYDDFDREKIFEGLGWLSVGAAKGAVTIVVDNEYKNEVEDLRRQLESIRARRMYKLYRKVNSLLGR